MLEPGKNSCNEELVRNETEIDGGTSLGGVSVLLCRKVWSALDASKSEVKLAFAHFVSKVSKDAEEAFYIAERERLRDLQFPVEKDQAEP